MPLQSWEHREKTVKTLTATFVDLGIAMIILYLKNNNVLSVLICSFCLFVVLFGIIKIIIIIAVRREKPLQSWERREKTVKTWTATFVDFGIVIILLHKT